MQRHTASAITLAGMLLLLGACAVGPDYTEPEADVQPEWIDTGNTLVNSTAALDPRWWETAFADPVLNELTNDALQQNLTLRSAGLRVLQSQQQLAIAVGNQYPQQQQIGALAERQQKSGYRFNDYNVDFNLAWELDFWGRFSRQVETAAAELDASVANYDDAMVSLVAQAAQSYILLRTFQDRLQIAHNNIKAQRESLRIAQAKLDAGDVSELDVDQATSLLHNTLATVPGLEISLQQTKNALALLLGESPQEFNQLAGTMGAIPTTTPAVTLGVPQDLIRQRPDVRAAERQLAAQSARIGFAVTELYPHFSIGGSIGSSAMDSDDLFSNDGEAWSFFGGFQWNVLNYGRLQSNVRLQDAVFQQLLVDYRFTVLQAQVDVENAIVAYLKSYEQVKAYRLAATASQKAVDIATAQYQDGLVDFNTVIGTLNALVAQQDVLASTRGEVATNLVQVYKALGGGWQIRDNHDPVDLLPASMKETMKQRTGAWEGVLE
ncbi:MAG: transporter [Gammaproteobacteria bacterium]|nr:MAG: transporter [Gammaproteobacteria bacterium]RLA55546.1 MAG: transporter [Gammaproteobacteria bacterium]HDY83935.1 efflux transporter outer membrane subunit [Halieaceae bacterium]